MLGETGMLLVRHRLSPSEASRARLRELIAANAGSDVRELLVGSPGTMLVARELGFDEDWQASADQLLADRDPETGLWEQNLWGQRASTSAPAHGFAGCVLALGELEGAAETLRRYAIVEDGLANWPQLRTGSSSDEAATRSACSGATAPRG